MTSGAVAGLIGFLPLPVGCGEKGKSGGNDYMAVASKGLRQLVPYLIVAFLLNACGTNQAYLGKARPDSDIATIEIEDSLLKDVSITSVDGEPFPSLSSGVTLLPGCHSLAVQVAHAGFYLPSYRGCATFSLYVEAGRTYLLQEHFASHISVSEVATGKLIARGSLRRIGTFGFCTALEDDSSAGCALLGATASDQLRHPTGFCRDAEDPERPWVGSWQVTRGDATLTLKIDAQNVYGHFDVRGGRYPVTGTVDDTGYVRAIMAPAAGGTESMGRLKGTFPEIGIASVGTGGMGQRLALYQGRVFRVCE